VEIPAVDPVDSEVDPAVDQDLTELMMLSLPESPKSLLKTRDLHPVDHLLLTLLHPPHTVLHPVHPADPVDTLVVDPDPVETEVESKSDSPNEPNELLSSSSEVDPKEVADPREDLLEDTLKKFLQNVNQKTTINQQSNTTTF
jgi:hypothetical protein